MWADPIVEEVRKVREAHAAKFHYDLREIYRDLKEKEKRSNWKLAPITAPAAYPDGPVAVASPRNSLLASEEAGPAGPEPTLRVARIRPLRLLRPGPKPRRIRQARCRSRESLPHMV